MFILEIPTEWWLVIVIQKEISHARHRVQDDSGVIRYITCNILHLVAKMKGYFRHISAENGIADVIELVMPWWHYSLATIRRRRKKRKSHVFFLNWWRRPMCAVYNAHELNQSLPSWPYLFPWVNVSGCCTTGLPLIIKECHY